MRHTTPANAGPRRRLDDGAGARPRRAQAVLALPDAVTALGSAPEGAHRSTRRVLRVAGVCCALFAGGALTIPVERTVDLDGRLVPAYVVPVRPRLDGVVTEVLVAPGDTVTTGRLLARLFSPERAAAHPRRSYLAHHDVHAPPRVSAGVVLTQDVDRLLGAYLDAGDLLLELAPLHAGTLPLTIQAHAVEQRAQRVRPGMPARLTFTAIPAERPRQAVGRVTRVGPASERAGGRFPAPQPPTGRLVEEITWRVEIAIDREGLDALIHPVSGSDALPTTLRLGFSVEIAVVERRETMARTATAWIRARWQDGRRPSRAERP